MSILHRLSILSAVVIGIATPLIASPAHAVLVSSNALFLAPSLVPTALYPEQNINLGGKFSYTSQSVGGILEGVEILPLLDPSPFPGNIQGAYTQAQLNSINVNNYHSFFFEQPNVNYFADYTSQDITVSFGMPGTYMVAIQAKNSQGVTFTKIYADFVDDAIGQNPGQGVPRDPVGPARVMSPANADLILVSRQSLEGPAANGYTAAAYAELKRQGKNVVLVDSPADAAKKIAAESKKLGRKITVALIGHGTPGTILLGKGVISKNGTGKNDMKAADFQKAIDQYTSTLDFFSCNTAAGKAGKDFITIFDNSLGNGNTRAYTTFTSAFPPTPELVANFNRFGQFIGWKRTGKTLPGYFDVGGMGIRGAIGGIPEPATWLMMLIGFTLVGLRVRQGEKRLPKPPADFCNNNAVTGAAI